MQDRKALYSIALPREPDANPLYVWLNDKIEVMVLLDRDHLRVIGSICPHMGARLEYQKQELVIFCLWHVLRFDSKALQCKHSQYKQIREYKGEVINKMLFVYE